MCKSFYSELVPEMFCSNCESTCQSTVEAINLDPIVECDECGNLLDFSTLSEE